MSDLIKREDAIKAMEQRHQDILRIFKRKVKDGEKAVVLDMIGCVKSLPSADRPRVNPDLAKDFLKRQYEAVLEENKMLKEDRPSGAWKEVVVDDDFPFTRRRFYCSACGGWQTYGRTDYCPHCGARMKGTDDETD